MAGIILNRNRQVPAEETPAFGGIAERFRRAGDLDRAIALCREGLKRFPDQLSARVTLGWSFLDKGQYDAARFELEQVLRKAPDNLAAIRGLAELHDRTEGSLPPEDERSWRSDAHAGTEVADVRAQESEPEPEPQTAAEPHAPLHVTLGHRAPEILHTAAHAEMAAEAAASVHVPMSLDVAPVELEGLADASMAAAASEPAQFFVGEPSEHFSFGADASADTAPAPFEVLGPSDVDSSELAEVAALIGRGLDNDADASVPVSVVAFDAGFGDEPREADAAAIITDTTDDDATLEEWATLAALAAEADAVAEAATAPVWDESRADAVLELAAAEAPALEDLAPVDANQIAVPEALDDIDELAGQDIADAIKALEDAARRVEARFAIRPALDRPAGTNEEIAAFDFGRSADVDVHSVAGSEAVVAPVDASYEGSFELVTPDLTDLAFSESVDSEDAADADELVAAPAAIEPTLDFERVPEEADAEPGTEEFDLRAGLDVADLESESPTLEQAAQPAIDVVSQDPTDAGADLLLASIEASIAGPGDVDDVVGSWSIGAGLPGPEADSTPIDVLGSMALHGAPGDVAADLSADLTAHDTASDDVVAPMDSPVEVGDASDVEYVVSEVAQADEQAPHAIEVVEASVEVLEWPDPEAIDLVAIEAADQSPDAVEVVEASVEVLELSDPETVDLVAIEAADSVVAEGDVADGQVVWGGEGFAPAAFEPSVELALDEATDQVVEEAELDLEPATADVEASADEVGHALPLAALVATDLSAPAPWHEAGEVAAAPVTAVYDAPVYSPLTTIVTAEVAALAGSFPRDTSVTSLVGHVETTTRSPLNRLERFLRQVQARQLELRGETVA